MTFERYLKRNKSISSFSYTVMFFFFIPQFGSYFRILSNEIVMNNHVEHLALNFKNKDTRLKEGQCVCVFGIPIACLKYILVRFRGFVLYQQKEKVFNEWHEEERILMDIKTCLSHSEYSQHFLVSVFLS